MKTKASIEIDLISVAAGRRTRFKGLEKNPEPL